MKTRFSKEESMLMMLYNPGSREGLIRELVDMKVQLAPEERRLARLTDRVIGKLKTMDDETFKGLAIYPE